MTRPNRITIYEVKQFLDKVYNIIGYNDFIAKDMEGKTEYLTRRISYILSKAYYYGLCEFVGTSKHSFTSKGRKMYRDVNRYRINKAMYKEKND